MGMWTISYGTHDEDMIANWLNKHGKSIVMNSKFVDIFTRIFWGLRLCIFAPSITLLHFHFDRLSLGGKSLLILSTTKDQGNQAVIQQLDYMKLWNIEAAKRSTYHSLQRRIQNLCIRERSMRLQHVKCRAPFRVLSWHHPLVYPLFYHLSTRQHLPTCKLNGHSLPRGSQQNLSVLLMRSPAVSDATSSA